MATFNRNWGFYTPCGWGSILTAYAPGTAITGTGAADFGSAIDASGYIKSSGVFSLTAPVTKTSGASAWSKSAGQTYNLTIGGDTWNITLTDLEAHATTSDGTLATDQMRYYLENDYRTVAAVNRADVTRSIILRDGSFFNATGALNYTIRLAAGGWPGAVTITNQGSGYTNSPTQGFFPTPLVGGTGTGAMAVIVVTSNKVAQVSIYDPGTGYTLGDTLTAPSLAGGSGFACTVVDLDAHILIRSETKTTGNDADGNPTRGGSAQHGGFGLNFSGAFSIRAPITVKWVWFYYNSPTVVTARQNFIDYPAIPSIAGWGVDSIENRFENGPLVPLDTGSPSYTACRNYGFNIRGGRCVDNHFENCQRGINQTVLGTTSTLTNVITGNVLHHCSDGMTLSATNYTITDNFIYSPRIKHGDHPDGMQHLGISTTLVGGTGYTNGTFTNVPLTTTGSVGVLATLTISGGIVTRVTPSAWTTMPEGAVYTIDVSETRVGPVPGAMRYTSGISVTNFGTIARNIIVRDNGNGEEDCQAIFLSDTRGPAFINGLNAYNNASLTTVPFGFLLTRFGNSSHRRSTSLGQLDSTAVGLSKPSITTRFDVPIGPVDLTSTIVADRLIGNIFTNVTNRTTASGTDTVRSIPIANPVTLAQALAAYAVMFPNYVSGETPGYTTAAAVAHALSPAILDVASGGARLPDGTYAGAFFPDGSWNDGTVYGSSGPTSYTATSPSSGAPTGIPITITLQLNAAATADVTFTPGVAGVSGSFSPAAPQILIGQSSVTVDFTATTAGTATVTFTNNRSLPNPAGLVFTMTAPNPDPTLYTQVAVPPVSVSLGQSITITYALDLAATAAVTITPACTLAGTFVTGSTVVIPIGETTGTAVFSPAMAGTATFSATDNRGLTDPASISVTVVAFNVAQLIVLGIRHP